MREGEGYVSVVARSAKPLGIPEEIARRYSPVSRASSPESRWHSSVRGKGGFVVSLPFASEDVSGNILNRALRGDDSDTEWRCYETRYSPARGNSAAPRNSKSLANSEPFKSPEVSSSSFIYTRYIHKCVSTVSSLWQSLVLDLTTRRTSYGRNMGVSMSLRCSALGISLSCFDSVSIVVECACEIEVLFIILL